MKVAHLLMSMGLTLALPVICQEPSVETIMNKHFAARGGVAKLKALESIRLKGVQVLMPAPMELPMLIDGARHQLPFLHRASRRAPGSAPQTVSGTGRREPCAG